MTRLVVVLGYSARRGNEIHPVCAQRVARAAELAGDGDVVFLSGTARELELMDAAWPPSSGRPKLDLARRTADSVIAALRLADQAGAAEIVLVTSWWHRGRAERMLQRALRGQTVRGRAVGAPSSRSARQHVHELASSPLAPIQLALARRRAPRR
jgi:hypothetical protein